MVQSVDLIGIPELTPPDSQRAPARSDLLARAGGPDRCARAPAQSSLAVGGHRLRVPARCALDAPRGSLRPVAHSGCADRLRGLWYRRPALPRRVTTAPADCPN